MTTTNAIHTARQTDDPVARGEPGGPGGASAVTPRLQAILERAGDAVTAKRVFGEPYERGGTAIIPVAVVLGGGGGGGGGGARGDGTAVQAAGSAGTAETPPGERRPASGPPAAEGAGGGFGLFAWPVGAYVLTGETVTWRPAVNVNLLALGAQLLALAAILTAGAVWRGHRRR
jgi:uncharacterized spore protein YtfJ